MFGTKKKQRSALPEKQQLTKYYEMDGALRAYANRMALLGMTCGMFALGTLALFAYVRLQPPVVIRVDNSGEATVWEAVAIPGEQWAASCRNPVDSELLSQACSRPFWTRRTAFQRLRALRPFCARDNVTTTGC
jgi:type IV secretory pathway TrbF-like protein